MTDETKMKTAPVRPSPPFRGEREGHMPEAREGEVDLGKRFGLCPLTPALSPDGEEGEMEARPFRVGL